MKQLILLIAALFMTCAAMAQRPLVTLSHNGELSFFDSNSAFEEALDSAQNGDYIYLSEGTFTSKKDEIEIKKRVSIVGSGYNSHIIPNIKIAISTRDSYMDAPMFDGVKIGKLQFPTNGNNKEYIKEVKIINSYISHLNDLANAGNDLLIDRCYVVKAHFTNCTDQINIVVQNSKIDETINNQYVTFINCNIRTAEYCPKSLISSILQKKLDNQTFKYGEPIISNSLFSNEFVTNNLLNQIAQYDCYFDDFTIDDNLEPNIDLLEKGYLGTDGTVIGVYGGAIPYSESPSMPTVDSANSTVTFDKETNKLKVDIKVSTK